ncbi:hypothetical protein N7467_009008 [Penicillium canescens]|nr:hypothetical protein N7467_009008 [Penicillium canescens]
MRIASRTVARARPAPTWRCHDGGYLELWSDMAEATDDAAAYGGCQGRDEGEENCCGDILGSWELELEQDVWED